MFNYIDLRYGIWGDYCKAQRYYNRDYVSTGFRYSPEPLQEILSEVVSKWKEFHPPHLWLVRLSHAIFYPGILLCLSQSDIYKFLIWAVFFQGIALNHAVADYIHVSQDVELAMLRLNYQGYGSGDCYLDSMTSETLLAYPLNLLYLISVEFAVPDDSIRRSRLVFTSAMGANTFYRHVSNVPSKLMYQLHIIRHSYILVVVHALIEYERLVACVVRQPQTLFF